MVLYRAGYRGAHWAELLRVTHEEQEHTGQSYPGLPRGAGLVVGQSYPGCHEESLVVGQGSAGLPGGGPGGRAG